MEMKYVREPGYVYDLFSPFVLYFNKEAFFKADINKDNEEAERKYFEGILDYFGPFPDDLYPFFCMKDNASSFVMQYYFYVHKSESFSDYSFKTMLESVKESEQVTKNILQFYFSDLDEKAINECMNSFQTVCAYINDSNYSDTLKCRLYAFFIDPLSSVQKLVYALQSAEVKLSQYYEKHYQQILDVQSSIDLVTLKKSFSELSNYQIDIKKHEDVYYTVCLILKNTIISMYCPGYTQLLVGWDYFQRLEYLISQNNSIELDILGTALSEQNRVEIFELMYKRGEITIKDIEQTMKISGTNAYYHLMLMLKANIVQTRNKGRTVCYRINKNQIDQICKYLSRYGNNSPEVK